MSSRLLTCMILALPAAAWLAPAPTQAAPAAVQAATEPAAGRNPPNAGRNPPQRQPVAKAPPRCEQNRPNGMVACTDKLKARSRDKAKGKVEHGWKVEKGEK